MIFKAIYSDRALKNLNKLGPGLAKNIVKKIGFYLESGDPLKYAKKLNPPFDKSYRFKVGEYRVIFEISSRGKITILLILKIAHRKDIYE